MTFTTFFRALAALLVGGMLVPALAFAQTDNNAPAGVVPAATRATAVPTAAPVRTKAMENATTRANQEIDRRTKQLTDLTVRVQKMEKVTDTFKSNLQSNIANQISQLSSLRTKINADTDADTLKADIKAIAPAYRVFSLVIQQSRVAAQADRTVSIATLMSQVLTKLQARVTAAQTAGSDTAALSALLTDLATKLQSAATKAQDAVSTSAVLTPDEGDKTKMAANLAVLKAARTKLQDAQKDLSAARKDIQKIIEGIRSLKTPEPASGAEQAQ